MGGPVAFGQTRVDCSKIQANNHEVVDVDAQNSSLNYYWTLPRTASSNHTIHVSRSLPVKVRDLIDLTSEKLDVNPTLVRAVAMVESGGNQGVVSPAGAVGVMQLMPRTARRLGVNPYDLEQNILGGGIYLKQQLARYQGSIPLALAAYNAGPGAVNKYMGVPPFKETRKYINRVINAMGRDKHE